MPGIQPGLHLETCWTARFILAVSFLVAHWDASERAIPGPYPIDRIVENVGCPELMVLCSSGEFY